MVFVKGSDELVEQRDRAIALLDRSIYDYFAFLPVAVPAGF